MKRGIFQMLYTSLFIIGTISCLNSNYNSERSNSHSSNSTLEIAFEKLSQIAIKDSVVIFRMDSLTTFDWDTLIIIKPFFPLDSLNQLSQIDLSQIIDRPALSDDGINVLVFIKNNLIVNVVRLQRNKGVFWNENVAIVTTNKNCVFEFVRSSNSNAFVEAKTRSKYF